MNYTFTIDADETQFILNTIGGLPTSSGAFPLLMKLQAQVIAQTQKEENPEEPKAE